MRQTKRQRNVPFLLKVVLLLTLAVTPTVVLTQPVLAQALRAAPIEASTVLLPNAIADGKPLRIDGSDEMLTINQMLKQRYEHQFPGAEVKLKANGTEAAIEKLLHDEIDLAAIGRSLTPTEKAQGLMEVPISRDKIAIIVGQENPFKGNLTVEQLSQIFRGKITDWAEVGGSPGSIRVIDRPGISDTRLALQRYQLFRDPDFAAATNVVRLKQDDTTSVIRELGHDGISYAIASQLIDQDQARVVKLIVTLDVLPEDALYPYAQTRSYVYKQTPNDLAQAFLGFATGRPGQAAVAAAKLAEAQAVAVGEAVALGMPARGIQDIPAKGDAEATTVADRRLQFWWIFLPLIGLGLLLLGLIRRFWPQAKPQGFVSPVPSPTPPTVKPGKPGKPNKLDKPVQHSKTPTQIQKENRSRQERSTGQQPLPTPTAASGLSELTVGQITAAELGEAIEDRPKLDGREDTLRVTRVPARQKPFTERAARSTPLQQPVLGELTIGQITAAELGIAGQQRPDPIEEPTSEIASPTIADSSVAENQGSIWITAANSETDVSPTPEIMTVEWVAVEKSTTADAELNPFGDVEASSWITAAEINHDSIETTEPESLEAILEATVLEPGTSLQDIQSLGEIVTLEEIVILEEIAASEEMVEDIPGLENFTILQEGVIKQVRTEESGAEAEAEAEIEIEQEAEAIPVEVDSQSSSPEVNPEFPLSGTPPELVSALSQPAVIPSIMSDMSDTLADGEFEPSLKRLFVSALQGQGKSVEIATPLECYSTLSSILCHQILALNTPEAHLTQLGTKIIGEISAEFLPGPHLENSLINLGQRDDVEQMLQELGLDLQQLIDQEEEPGLGRGGLGRLMVCYLDALSTANIPAIGYGIRYEYGIFDQTIQDGWQVEVTDTWLRNGNPWEVARPEKAVTVKFGGYTEAYIDDQDRYRVRWLPATVVQGTPYDTPIPGYQTQVVNLLRLWKAETTENLGRILYPVDIEIQGKALRLQQQFFLVSCALQDAVRLHFQFSGQPDTLQERFALQLNDTDPTLAIAELMRLLVDEHGLAWEQAWDVTQRTFAYTNHSLMPETLDDHWSVEMFGQVLPRHLELIYEINYRFLETIKATYPEDVDRLNRMSLIDERGERYVRLSYLACLGCHAINGVSGLHTDLLKQTVLQDFYKLYPDKFSNQTNGITPRRFLLQGHPDLSALISSVIGDAWITDLDRLQDLESYAKDPAFRSQWQQVKQTAKQHLATQIRQQTGISVDPASLFDVQAMVIHEYKRQHLNVLRILTLYNRIKANPDLEIVPRTFIFAGKAAPDYFAAKLIIKLINTVADLINQDRDVRGRLKVVFLPDWNIKSAQSIYPAADLAEYISLAGTEASDTGNMIFALNGSRLIGTPDGSNLEIREAIGADQFFLFGQTVEQVMQRRTQGYSSLEIYQANPDLKAAIDRLTSEMLVGNNLELFRPLVNLLLYSDQYMVLADYPAYLTCQEQVSQAYQDPDRWTEQAILATARMGRFSADRAVRDYCQTIWQIPIDQSPSTQASAQGLPAKK